MRKIFDDASEEFDQPSLHLSSLSREIGEDESLECCEAAGARQMLQLKSWDAQMLSDNEMMQFPIESHCGIYAGASQPLVYTGEALSPMPGDTQLKEEDSDSDCDNSMLCGKRRQKKKRSFKRAKFAKKTESGEQDLFKKLRNRMSAQKSRDRKRKEMDELQEENTCLRRENEILRSQLSQANSRMEAINRVVESLPKEEQEVLLETQPTKSAAASRSSRRNVLMTAMMIGCLCFSACLSSLAIKSPEVKDLVPKIEPILSGQMLLPPPPKVIPAAVSRVVRRQYIEEKGRVAAQSSTPFDAHSLFPPPHLSSVYGDSGLSETNIGSSPAREEDAMQEPGILQIS